ncbi:MAG: phytoene desaturase [Rhodospirillaceae bacterium]|nr:phytoene desaturase [Rhodospirillaceae bacterium]
MTTPQAVVIGSGFGGLAAAIRLQSAGIQTTLLEARDKPGGRAYVFEDHGFTFDAGPTVITDPSCLEELFALTDRQLSDYVDLVPVDPFYRLIWEDGHTFDYTNNQDELEQQISALSPADVEGYRHFFKYSEAVFEEGYCKLGHVPFPNFWSMVRVAPQLLKLGSYRSVHNVVARHIKHPLLRQAFSFHSLLVGGNPFQTPAIYVLIHALERKWGVYYPKGGTGALVQGLVRLFTDLGGTLRLNSPVDLIDTHDDRVSGIRLINGQTSAFDIVVSNADVVHTYQNLLRKHPQGRRVGARLAAKNFSNSLFVVYFGLRGAYPDIRHHTVLFGPRYKGLLTDIFRRGVLSDDFSLYLHAPSATDPSLAPEGCSTYYALSPVPHLGKNDLDWETLGPVYRDQILDHLEQRLMPGLRKNLVTTRIFTPTDFQDQLNAYHGSAFSLEPTLMQSAYFRAQNRDDRIAGLYVVGAGTHPGAGIPGVVGSAKATSGIILEDHDMNPVSVPKAA